jgi:uncharacterized membrane protein YedE/YeeE
MDWTHAPPLAGLIFGFCTRLGSGCSNGHSVCGLSHLPPRSMETTGAFLVAGFITVPAMRAFELAW